jgi:hypothetical protein
MLLKKALEEAHEIVTFTSAISQVTESILENIVAEDTARISSSILALEHTQSALAQEHIQIGITKMV